MSETLRVDSDGLYLPEKYRDADVAFVVRTPTATIQTMGALPIDEIYPLVDPRHWQTDTTATIRNPTALADGGKVGLKQYGEPLEWYPVEIVTNTGEGNE